MTVPAATATTGPGPGRAARSTPECSFQTCLIGWKRIPNVEVRTYACWKGGRHTPSAPVMLPQG